MRQLLGRTGLPPEGMPADRLLAEAARLLFDHSLCNGHPRFWGYITSSAAPIGALADLLAAAVNPNLAAWQLSPIAADRAEGHLPFIVVASAGSVSTGAIDPLADIATLCKQHDLWLHIDGAYGAPAAAIAELTGAFAGLGQADSVALDPHKWLYSPLEAGCALVRNPELLRDTFRFHPVYYEFETSDEEPGINYYEYGIQNSRGSRALRVWLALRQVGRAGYVEMIRDDIALAERLFNLVDKHAELEAFTHNLSITTFRYLPARLAAAGNEADPYLNDLHRVLVTQLQAEGEAFVSNAFINDRYYLRACVVNFRTTRGDIDRLPEIVTRLGQQLDAKMRPDPS